MITRQGQAHDQLMSDGEHSSCRPVGRISKIRARDASHHALIACLAASVAVPATAQTTAAAAAPTAPAATATGASNQNGIADIIVTAQKRSERLRDVPLSVTAASGEQLARQGVIRPADLEKIVPGFTYQPSTYGTPVFTIRGIGFFDTSLASSPTVTVYVDQVPLPYLQMTPGASLDVERVEALKGPQGTLFGQNATGGAINYIAAKPTPDLHAGLDLGYGRFNAFTAQGFVSGPIAPNLRARVSVRTEQSGDWQKSQTRDDTLGQRNFTTARLLLDWTPSDAITFELNANGWRDRSDTQAAQFIRYNAPPPNNYPDQAPALLALKPAPNDARIADWDPDTSLRRNDRFGQISLRGDVRLADDLTLTSITAYSDLKVHAPTDVDGTAIDNFLLILRGSIKTFYQEVRLAGRAGDKLKWIVGGNYGHDSTHDDQMGIYGGSNSGVGPFRYTSFINENNQKVDTRSVFGNVDYALTSNIGLQGAVRYTSQSRDFRGCLRDPGDGKLADAFSFLSSVLRGFAPPAITIAPGACVTLDDENADNLHLPTGLVSKSLHEHNVSWRAGATWKPSTNSMIYANVTKGYKSGSFGTLPAIDSSEFTPVVQESILAYEAGFKTALFDNRLQLDAAAFYYKYNNKQTRGRIDVGPPFGLLEALINIPRSSVRGGELEVTWRPIHPLTVRAGATYLDSRVDRSFFTQDPIGNTIDIKGESFPSTPKWQMSGDVEYDFDVNDRLKAYVGANSRYRTRAQAAFGGLPDFELPGYATLDLRAGVQTADGSWRLEGWARNVTNKFYLIHVSHLLDAIQRVTGMPVTYGATVGYRF